MSANQGPEQPSSSSPSASGPSSPPAVVLCSEDASLRAAWQDVDAPAGFRLETADRPQPEHLRGGAGFLVVDAAAYLADEAVADLLDESLPRCVWAGEAAELGRLPPAVLRDAYDVLQTPTTAAVLGRRLAGWARSIRQTAALEEVGGRVEGLAERNDDLARRLAEAETRIELLQRERERLDKAFHRLRQVAGLSHEINSLDLAQIVQVSTDRLPNIVGARRASLYLYDAVSDHLVLQRHTHGYAIAERIDLKDHPQSPMAIAVRQGEPVLVSEFGAFERQQDVAVDRAYPDRYETASCIIVPLKGGGRVRGILNMADKEEGESFDAEVDLPVVEQIAELIGASIYNVELYQQMERQAKTDFLTDMPNRRAIEEALAREVERSRRYGTDLSVLMFDVDQLKRINDEFGHHVGDRVLRHVASVMKEGVRSVDVPGRWAGDEFLVVLPDTGAGPARRLAKRLLKSIRANPPTIQDQSIFSSLSAGVAQYRQKESVIDIIRRVDLAMYEAKKAGRDRIATAR